MIYLSYVTSCGFTYVRILVKNTDYILIKVHSPEFRRTLYFPETVLLIVLIRMIFHREEQVEHILIESII